MSTPQESKAATGHRQPPAVVELQASELPAPGTVFCPNPKMTLWNTHPRVFLETGTTGEAKCPYCGTLYRVIGAAGHGH